MSAQEKGSRYGAKLDQANDQAKDAAMNKSYRDLGNDVGKQLDAAARRLNDRTADSNGKKADQHLSELYDSSISLASHTYDYAWSWIPFTQKKARQIRNDPKGQAKEGKENVKDAARTGGKQGEEVAEDAKQTIFDLVNEARGLTGQILDTAHHYVVVADKKTQETANDAQASGKAPVRAAGGMIGATRNLAAAMIEKTRDVVCYGMEQGEDARYHSKQVSRDAQNKANDYTNQAKQMAGKAVGTAQKYGQAAQNGMQQKANEAKQQVDGNTPAVDGQASANGGLDKGRPGFNVSVQL